MKKILAAVLLLTMIGIVFAGCAKDMDSYSTDNPSTNKSSNDIDKDDVDGEYRIFEADVTENKDNLLVSPDENSFEFLSSDRIYVGLSGVKDKPELLKPGDKVKIYYNGLIAESYPARISADKIEIIGHNPIVDGFFTLIDNIYKEDIGLNDGITMIAFDTSNLEQLSKSEIETILAMVKNEYGLEVTQGTFDELSEQGLIDKDKLYFEKGILIEFKDVEVNRKKSKITCSISKWRSGLGAIGWDAIIEYDDGDWNITRKNLWIS